MFNSSIERYNFNFVYHHMFKLGRFRWNQRLFNLRFKFNFWKIHQILLILCFLAWKNDPTQSIMITLTNRSIFQVRLPATFDQSSSYHLVVHIRDSFDSTTQFQLSSVEVFPDNDIIQQLIQLLQNDDVQQISTVCSQYLNEINQQNIKTLTSSNSFIENK